jgi:DNA-binding MarR family transcriptional regulator
MAQEWFGGERFARVPLSWLTWDLTPTELRVGLALCAHAGHEGKCWPSKSKISDLTGVDVHHVRRALRSLESKGLLQTSGRTGRSSMYTLQVPQEAAIAPSEQTAPWFELLASYRAEAKRRQRCWFEKFYGLPHPQYFEKDPEDAVRLEDELLSKYFEEWRLLEQEADRKIVCSRGLRDHVREECDERCRLLGDPFYPDEAGYLKMAQEDWQRNLVGGLAEWCVVYRKVNPWAEGFDIQAHIDEITDGDWCD